MATPYKRYIPPKAPIVDGSPLLEPSFTDKTQPAPALSEKKRKRERPPHEIAERKAKKLKKKGIESRSTQNEDRGAVKSGNELVQTSVSEVRRKSPEVADAGQAKSEFAHVNSVKKRHKLEKEARKARKDAVKDSPGIGDERIENRVNEQKAATFVPTASQENDAQPKATKPKRSGLRKSASTVEEQAGADNHDELHSRPTGEDAILGDRFEASVVAEVQPKKRRHKLEHALAQSKIENNDHSHTQKHGSVLEKFGKSMRQNTDTEIESRVENLSTLPTVQHLELPDPVADLPAEFASNETALPSWLKEPTVVTPTDHMSFAQLGLKSEIAARLSQLGFAEALPVQTALVPLILQPGLPGSAFLPGTEDILPDLAVSAPTGSGKTIAYLLPIVEALRERGHIGKLQALVVVPTRELVVQVAAVAESLAKGSDVQVGMATGGGRFRDEQSKLISRGRCYDPAGYKALIDRAGRQIQPPDETSNEFDAFVEECAIQDPKMQQKVTDALEGPVQHVPTYDSAIDILVATPGRILEHLKNTPGFTLVYSQWLVIDEADKILDNQSEGFIEFLNVELTRQRTLDEQDGRERYLRSRDDWDETRERRLRKIVLSATMTRDISKLMSLKLRRPRMVVVRTSNGSMEPAMDDEAAAQPTYDAEASDGIELPRALVEYCVPVGDGSEKPLIAIELLKSRILNLHEPSKTLAESQTVRDAVADEGGIVDSDSSSFSESSSSPSVSSSSPSESDDSDSSDSSYESDESSVRSDVDEDQLPSTIFPSAAIAQPSTAQFSPSGPATVLVFTASNESAHRLAHLLRSLQPLWVRSITTLVKSQNGSARIRSPPSAPAIVISTDRAARGLDSLRDVHGDARPITHVLQYDVPRSRTAYVHRAGRTARAGRPGHAWTLYSHHEARWFVAEIVNAPAQTLRRSLPVERVKIFNKDEDLRANYAQALESMREEVYGSRKAK